jgi:hypothetical protein
VADRYWIGGSGNVSDTGHWSESSGGEGGASVPTSGDIVYFEGSSSEDQIVTFDIDITCNSMWSDPINPYPMILDLNSKTLTVNSILINDSELISVLDITNAIINANSWAMENGVSVLSDGSTINIRANSELGDPNASFRDYVGNNYNDLNLDFGGANEASIAIMYNQDISFNNVTVTPDADIDVNLYVGPRTENEAQERFTLTCNNWAVTGSVEDNFHITIDSTNSMPEPN